MNFNSAEFLLFLPAVLLLNALLFVIIGLEVVVEPSQPSLGEERVFGAGSEFVLQSALPLLKSALVHRSAPLVAG